MIAAHEEFEQLADAMEANAREHEENLRLLSPGDRCGYVRDVVTQSTIVYAIWHDGEYRHLYCVKGYDTPEGALVPMVGIFVKDIEAAKVIQRNWGDGESDRSSTH